MARVRRWVVTAAAVGLSSAAIHAQVPPREQQIAGAVLAAPEDRRDGAWVYGYEADGSFALLREGSNDMICLADDPRAEKLSVACYHKSLEPFMARGRELRAQGITDHGELTLRRNADVDAGKLEMPEQPATLYVLSGSGFDAASGTVADPYLRWVVYTPYATADSTGLSLNPQAPGAPWIMFPGTPGAHIMIVPPRPEKKP